MSDRGVGDRLNILKGEVADLGNLSEDTEVDGADKVLLKGPRGANGEAPGCSTALKGWLPKPYHTTASLSFLFFVPL